LINELRAALRFAAWARTRWNKFVKILRKTFSDDTRIIAAIALLGLVMIALFRP
jgi:hypothetical protein